MLDLAVIVVESALVMAVAATVLIVLVSDMRSVVGGAPFSPIPRNLIPELIDMARVTGADRVVDLGCGDGRMLDAVLSGGAASAVGYDVAWWPLFLARRRLKRWGDRVHLFRADAKTADLTGATVVYLYLFPKLVDRLAPIIAARVPSGTRVLCPAFAIDRARHPQFRLLDSRKMAWMTSYLYERV